MAAFDAKLGWMVLLGAGLFAGCAPLTMQVPPGVASADALKVGGYSQSLKGLTNKDLTLGAYAVTDIDRDWNRGSSQSAGPFGRDSQKKAFRYEVKAQGQGLHGECTEQAVTHTVMGFEKSKVSFGCVCTAAGATQAKLELVDGVGRAELGTDRRFEVTAVFESAQGHTQRQPLGYHFRDAQGEGAVDVSESGRAWVPQNLLEPQRMGLVCAYAGLLLYLPTDTDAR
jgi:hypothetical protein